MKRWTASLAVFGVFALGAVVGGAVVFVGTGRALAPGGAFGIRGTGPGAGGPGAGGGMFVERLERRLGLTEEQKTRIDEILRDAHQEGEELRREMLPRVREHMDQTRQRILDVLTPEQRVQFEELQRRHRRRAERFLFGPPPWHDAPGPGPGPGPDPGPPPDGEGD